MSREALALVRLTIPETQAAPLEQVEAYVAQALRADGFNITRVDIDWLPTFGRVETCPRCFHVAEVHGGEKGCTGWDASHIGGICGCTEARPFAWEESHDA